ncbi:ATP-dependent DNA helicase RecG [Sphingobacterium alkalisoli]|uniref:ATP-dependent DNA helicase RecG n=1 Tax=Sphingobacterium alkalisoli TaxID=1874115 RepID=A0A4U0H9K1_9SPHI|nr:ATP-dependent DNA helicase RecG [Sphingobacterium alkalisoli]TJY68064.1 ATP-dependent DNA helicase RecG [Sphingobacterium alkalisoli]GGH09305.1 ATP-dependent DNA helicase RecG [Sphingobacterium alkalisoli]
MADLSLITPIEYLKGVGPQKADVLKKELQIFTIGDLLQNYPFRYIDRTKFYKVQQLHPDLVGAQVLGRLINLQELGEKRSRRLVGQLRDDTGMIELVWFQSITWLKKNLKIGSVYIVYGKPTEFNGQLSITHPEMDLYNSHEKKVGNMSMQPVYSSTEKLKKFNLDTKGIQRLQQTALETVFRTLQESIPNYILERHRLLPYPQALVAIHFPQQVNELNAAIQRLKFEELFFIQLRLLRNKQLNTQRYKGHRFDQVGDKFNTFFAERLPFPLTNAQKRVVKEIRLDTNTGAQMNRLVQGDVGSGKTIVALMSMLLAVDNGYQACMMAPTEILAIQHYKGLKELLGEDICTIKLLTGSTSVKERRILHQELEEGTLDILIGTHALIEDKVKFKNIGFVVIDEQHRFGVEQRAKLWRKNSIPPHMLVMTATPIPRTLAMTLYGDLDISIIDELPAGRKPIKTVHFFESSRLRMFGFMRDEIAKGRQVYIVFPLIKESEKLDLLYLEAGLENLQREFPLPQYKISIVHGKMPVKDKDFEMQRFVKGETQIMVATTVIEVGVNVPNASVMVIENAERFGLSQLHQLRGRVGRGAEQSYCILMSGNKLSKDGRQRLETMVRTNDGFEIAEVDLQLRGPGDISGTQQSGVLEMKIANLASDQAILAEARETVIEIFKEDPSLSSEKNRLLANYLNQRSPLFNWDKIS